MTLTLSLAAWLATLVAGAAVVLALSVGALLLRRREGSPQANASMGGLLVLGALTVLYQLLLNVQPPGEHLRLVLAPLPYTLSLGPLLYTYVRARAGRGAPHALHAVLPVAQAIVVLGVGLAPQSIQAWYAAYVFFPVWASLQVGCVVLSLAAYFALSVRVLRRASQRGAAPAWALRRDRWLAVLLGGVAASAVAVAVVDLALPLATGQPGNAWGAALSVGLYAGVLALAAAGGLVQAGILSIGGSAESLPLEPRPALDPAVAEAHAAALAAHVAQERPYLDPDLTLGALAAAIGVTDKVLSAVLNEHLGTSYTDYVNALRVDEARRRLADPDFAHLTVLAVGLDAGFASKSTFNRVFKERTGQTPSASRSAATGP